jgi:hypothetical protein
MKAIAQDRYGDASVLALRDIDPPEPPRLSARSRAGTPLVRVS